MEKSNKTIYKEQNDKGHGFNPEGATWYTPTQYEDIEVPEIQEYRCRTTEATYLVTDVEGPWAVEVPPIISQEQATKLAQTLIGYGYTGEFAYTHESVTVFVYKDADSLYPLPVEDVGGRRGWRGPESTDYVVSYADLGLEVEA